MSLRTITGTILTPDGTPIANARIVFELQGTGYATNGQYPPRTTLALTGNDGTFTVSLWPNTLGVVASSYLCHMPTGEAFAFILPEGEPITLTAVRALGEVDVNWNENTLSTFALLKSANLADVPDKPTALANLGGASADSLTSEATARANADTALTNAITAEASARASADAAVAAAAATDATTKANAAAAAAIAAAATDATTKADAAQAAAIAAAATDATTKANAAQAAAIAAAATDATTKADAAQAAAIAAAATDATTKANAAQAAAIAAAAADATTKANAAQAAANASGERLSLGTLSTAGNTDVTASSSLKRRVTAEATIGAGGGAFTRTITLTSTNAQAGDARVVRLAMPASANPTIEVRNLTSGGTLLATVVLPIPAGGTASVVVECYFDGTNWQLRHVNRALAAGTDVSRATTNLVQVSSHDVLRMLTQPSFVNYIAVVGSNFTQTLTGSATSTADNRVVVLNTGATAGSTAKRAYSSRTAISNQPEESGSNVNYDYTVSAGFSIQWSNPAADTAVWRVALRSAGEAFGALSLKAIGFKAEGQTLKGIWSTGSGGEQEVTLATISSRRRHYQFIARAGIIQWYYEGSLLATTTGGPTGLGGGSDHGVSMEITNGSEASGKTLEVFSANIFTSKN